MPDTPDTPQITAQQLIGDSAPKLASLSDGVLSGDVWETRGSSS